MSGASGLRSVVTIAVDRLIARIEELEAENAKLHATVARLGRENSEQCDAIYELQQMNNRAQGAAE